MKLVPLYVQLTEYTQTEEIALAVEMVGNPENYQPALFNSTINAPRRWNGTAFVSMVEMPSSVQGGFSSNSHSHPGVFEPINANIQAHVISTHAPANAQANAAITQAEIEAKLIGTIASHSHAGGSGDMVLASAQTNSGLKTFLNGTFGLRNVANTITSLFSTAATVARTWTMKDADGTVAFVADITGTNSGTNTGDTAPNSSSAPSAHVGAGGTAHADAVAAGAAGFMTGADKTKLNGIATAATANSADVTLVARANHTGTQLAATISDLNASVPNAHYRTILESAGSHIAGRVAGTYAIPMGEALAISGTGTLYPINTIYIVAADYPTVNGLAAKLRIRAQLFTNDVAPTGNYTIGLYPVTRPATSGGAGVCIYTLGTVVAGSNGATVTAPAADLPGQAVGADFAMPTDGHYVLGVVTTATVAVAALVHVVAKLQMRNA